MKAGNNSRQSPLVFESPRRIKMAQAAGDLLTVPTLKGNAEAKRMGRAEAGQSRWWIRYPWAAESFYGTAEAAMAHMNKRIGEQDAQEPGQG
jgi:hypothetical protein